MATKRQLIANAMEAAQKFRFFGPSDDPDEQTAVTVGFRHLIIQLQRMASPLLPASAASRLNTIDVEVNNVYSAFDAKAELDALLPDIESVIKALDAAEKESTTSVTAKPLPVPICSIVGDVLGSFIYNHRTLHRLFYQAGAVGEVPPGNGMGGLENLWTGG